MKNSPDPSVHREREQKLVQHVERLLADDRLRVDTTRGNRAITTLLRDVTRSDHAVDLKRLMSDMNVPDRELQARMPIGETLEVTLSQTSWWFLKKTVGRLRVVCVSPTRALLAGDEPKPMTTQDLQKLLSALPPSLGGVPSTVVVLSTSGFTLEAHEVADRRAERSVILVEPVDGGGWKVTGPAQTRAISDLFDPEAQDEKRRRVRAYVEGNKAELLNSGIVADRIAAKAQLSPQLVEAELKAYAKENPGLTAKRLDGRVVLFREGASLGPTPSSSSAGAGAAGGSDMPLLDRMKALFARKGDNEKKIAFLSERRTALSQQRDRAYEDMAALEQQEAGLRSQFKDATAGAITKRRVTSQLLQLRKDVERRQQLLGVLNQQINVVSTHLHNLELVQQGEGARLPDSEEMTADAVKAEEMLAELEASNELAGATGSMATSGMSAEEQALFEELERDAGGAGATTTPIKLAHAEHGDEDEPAPADAGNARATAAARTEARRTEPEAG